MASSVSSERAFSQGGITISKRRSCLKGDIVEALQCVKCAIWHDLLFQEPAPSSMMEMDDDGDLEGDDIDGESSGSGEKGWEELIIDDEDEILTAEEDD